MAKPSITTRTGKGSPLNYSELDTNFTNLRDATITVTDGTNSTAIDLNGTIEFAAGSNITLTENNGVITVAATGGIEEIAIPVAGTNYDVLYADGNEIYLRDNENSTTPGAYVKLYGGALSNSSKLYSNAGWEITTELSTDTYSVLHSAPVETVVRFQGGGLVLPVVTTTERDNTNITTVAGTVVFNETTGNFEGYNGTSWVTLG